MAKITKEAVEDTGFEVGSGNIYADLGYPDPEEMAAKAELVRVIGSTIEAVGLSQTMAAKMMGVDQPTLSKLLRGRVRNFTIDRLSGMLRGLGRNVTIRVESMERATPAAEPRSEIERGHVRVLADELLVAHA